MRDFERLLVLVLVLASVSACSDEVRFEQLAAPKIWWVAGTMCSAYRVIDANEQRWHSKPGCENGPFAFESRGRAPGALGQLRTLLSTLPAANAPGAASCNGADIHYFALQEGAQVKASRWFVCQRSAVFRDPRPEDFAEPYRSIAAILDGS
jgi:hypothetical protein